MLKDPGFRCAASRLRKYKDGLLQIIKTLTERLDSLPLIYLRGVIIRITCNPFPGKPTRYERH